MRRTSRAAPIASSSSPMAGSSATAPDRSRRRRRGDGMSMLALAVRLMRRELRGGLRGFRIFLACLALGVAVIAGVGSLAAGVRAGLEGDARAMLGGDVELDLVLRPASEAERHYLDQSGTVAEVIGMRAMARRDDNTRRSLI